MTWETVEIRTGALVLRIRPSLDRGGVIILQPLVIVRDFGPVVFVRDRLFLGDGRRGQIGRAQTGKKKDRERAGDKEFEFHNHA